MFTSDEMTNEEYHADPALSSSAIKTVASAKIAQPLPWVARSTPNC